MAKDKDTSLLGSRIFPIYKDSDIVSTKNDLAILDKNLIEASQDDDVDTDDEILESAMNNCFTDLYRADKTITKYDGTLMISRLRNYSIYTRTAKPDFFDRNGIYREPQVNARHYRDGKMSPIVI